MTYSDFLTGDRPKLTENQVGVIEYLDRQFLSHEGVTRMISYRVPFYKLNKRICYINPKKGVVKKNATALCPYHHCTNASCTPAYIE